MASAAKELEYRSRRAVDGSLAYNLDWELRERELSHAGEAPRELPRTRRQEKAKVHTRAHVQVREAQHVSPVSVLSVVAALGMALLLLNSYIDLTMISSETVKLQQELEVLETENVALTAEYQQIFDLGAIKEAALAAGMDKPSSSQICYIDLSVGDSAEVYQQENPSVLQRGLDALRRSAAAVWEYFN